jgi:tetratricopeptide (TPR) repeat protein
MDERLRAGRHHLVNGDRALQQGFPDDGRAHFESALLQFRGPELLLGEALARRGLAQVDLAVGRPEAAEAGVRRSLALFDEAEAVFTRLDALERARAARVEVRSGRATALVLLSDVLVRSGRTGEAREALEQALAWIDGAADFAAAAYAWAALGRIATREGRLAEASDLLERAVTRHEASGSKEGAVGARLAWAEALVARGDVARAEVVLQEALYQSRDGQHRYLEGRAMSALGALMLRSRRLDEARTWYTAALPAVRRASDAEAEGLVLLGLGETESRLGQVGALAHLVEGARRMGSFKGHSAIPVALLRIADHGVRVGAHGVALVAAEAARRVWVAAGSATGQGNALRVLVKAASSLQQFRPTLGAAAQRARLVGATTPNAVAVADWYAARVPSEWRAEVLGMADDALAADVTARIEAVASAVLSPVGLSPAVLDGLDSVLSAITRLVDGTVSWLVADVESTHEGAPSDEPTLVDPPVSAPLVLPPDQRMSRASAPVRSLEPTEELATESVASRADDPSVATEMMDAPLPRSMAAAMLALPVGLAVEPEHEPAAPDLGPSSTATDSSPEPTDGPSAFDGLTIPDPLEIDVDDLEPLLTEELELLDPAMVDAARRSGIGLTPLVSALRNNQPAPASQGTTGPAGPVPDLLAATPPPPAPAVARPVEAPAAAPADGYEGLYAPPADADEELAQAGSSPEVDDYDDAEIEALRRSVELPDEYAGLYAPPTDAD